MRRFEQREIIEAMAWAATGRQALHVHRFTAPSTAPACFRQGPMQQMAHLFDQDSDRLIATGKRLGVKRVFIDKRGRPSQHIDLCGRPLERALKEAYHAKDVGAEDLLPRDVLDVDLSMLVAANIAADYLGVPPASRPAFDREFERAWNDRLRAKEEADREDDIMLGACAHCGRMASEHLAPAFACPSQTEPPAPAITMIEMTPAERAFAEGMVRARTIADAEIRRGYGVPQHLIGISGPAPMGIINPNPPCGAIEWAPAPTSSLPTSAPPTSVPTLPARLPRPTYPCAIDPPAPREPDGGI